MAKKDHIVVKASPDGVALASDPVEFDGAPPRLVVCLNHTKTDFPDGVEGSGDSSRSVLDADDPKSLETILAWIEERLHRSLDEAWAGPAGKNDEWDPNDPEEAWARAVTEILFGARYGGPGQCYFGNDKWDSYIFSRIQGKSISYHEAAKARKKATFPATYLEILLYKNKLEREKKTLESVMLENTDPAVSLAVACQHATTYGALTRGFTLEEHLDGCNFAAAQNDGKPIFKLPGAKWYPTNLSHLKVKVATGLEAIIPPKGSKDSPETIEVPLGPGTIYTYNPFGDAKHATAWVPTDWISIDEKGTPYVNQQNLDKALNTYVQKKRTINSPPKVQEVDPEVQATIATPATASTPTLFSDPNLRVEVSIPLSGQRKGSHISFVLRVSPDKTKVQRFDTSNGYPERAFRDHSLMKPTGREGIYDGNFVSQVSQGTTFCGMGVLPKPDNEALAKQISFIRQARPIGLMRLVITERIPPIEMTDHHVLYISRLIRMYGDGESENFNIARAIWSLRNMPGFSNIQAWWIIYIPRDELARLMWAHGARSHKLYQLEPQVSFIRHLKFKNRQAKTNNKLSSLEPGLHYMHDFRDTIVLTNDAKGKSLYWQRKRSAFSFGLTNENHQGLALPDAIRDRIAPKPGRNLGLEIPWNGERISPRLEDPYTGDAAIEIPSLLRDGEDLETMGTDETDGLPGILELDMSSQMIADQDLSADKVELV